MKRLTGVTVVELLVALVVVAIIGTSFTSLLVGNLGMRRGSQLDTVALEYANTVLERFKTTWIDPNAFRSGQVPNPMPAEPSALAGLIDITIVCVGTNGVEIVCPAAGTPPLRRVVVRIGDGSGGTRVMLVTEIGRPVS